MDPQGLFDFGDIIYKFTLLAKTEYETTIQ